MEVSFYQSSQGTFQIKGDIKNLPAKVKKKILRALELLKEKGMAFVTHSGLMRKLHGHSLYELKIDCNRVCYRIMCVIRSGTCWLLSMFTKKSNSTPFREIETAMNRAKDLDLQLAT